MDEKMFTGFFNQVPSVQVNSSKDVDGFLKKFDDILKNKEKWKEWVECLQMIRSLLLAQAMKYDEFYDHLHRLLPLFHAATKSLRSIVVREACVTIAFLSVNLGNRFDYFAESILSNLIELIQKSQKVFASSALVCVRFIIKNTHTPRLISTITNNLDSKNKDIRRACCEFLCLILQTWQTHTIKRFAFEIRAAIKKGIADADAEARCHSRNAFAEFSKLFPRMAVNVEKSLNGSSSLSKSAFLARSNHTEPNRNMNPPVTKSTKTQDAPRPGRGFDFKTPVSRTTAPTKTVDLEIDSGDSSSRYSISLPINRSSLPRSHVSDDSLETSPNCSFQTPDDHVEYEISSTSSDSSDSGNSWQNPPGSKVSDTSLRDIGNIISSCESLLWIERKAGLIGLQNFIQEGNRLKLSDLKKIMDLFLKIFNDPHIRVFSLFLDTVNELILSQSVDMYFCLHQLLVRLFNKLSTDLLDSAHSKIKKTLDNVFSNFPPDLLIQSVFRFLVDQTPTSDHRVELAALDYILKLIPSVSPRRFSSNYYTTMVLAKMVGWTMTGNVESGTELRKVAEDVILALYTSNRSPVIDCLSSMPVQYQERLTSICRSKCLELPAADNYEGKLETVPQTDGRREYNTCENVIALKAYIDELSHTENLSERRDLLMKITKLVEESTPDVVNVNFKILMGKIVSFLTLNEPVIIKEAALNLLQLLVKQQTVALKNFSELIIVKVLAMCCDSSTVVVKAAQNCAMVLSTHLPPDCVIGICVPLIPSEAPPIKLTAIKMLTHLVELWDDSVTLANIDLIMPVLLMAFDDTESSVRKAAVFLIVALYTQSEGMKLVLEPYISELEGRKSKLLRLYIDRAVEGRL